jgi:Mn-containing catalase
VQSFHVENVDIRDMFQDIAIEEFSHLEMVGKLIAQHTSELDQTSLHDAPLLKLKAATPTSGQPRQLLHSSLHPRGGNVVNAHDEDHKARVSRPGKKRAGAPAPTA